MRTFLVLIFSAITSISLRAAPAPASAPLVVYAYDSFCSKGSLGEFLKDKFKAKTGQTMKCVPFGSAGEALNQVVLDGKKARADILVGADATLLARARKTDLFAVNEAKIPESIPHELQFDTEKKFVPFDYGYLAFVYDSSRTTLKDGQSLESLASMASLAHRIVIEDPRTSSLGLGFLVWTHLQFSSEARKQFWKTFSNQLVTIAPGWSGAYGLFSKKGADVVLSYTTSPAYHMEMEKNFSIRAIPFAEGHFRQIETVATVKGSARTNLAKQWIELLLSDEIQGELGRRQWMYPASRTARVPPSFAKLPTVKKAIDADPAMVESSKAQWIQDWAQSLNKVQ